MKRDIHPDYHPVVVRDEHAQRLLGGDAARRLAQRTAGKYYERRGQSSHHSWPSLPHRIMT